MINAPCGCQFNTNRYCTHPCPVAEATMHPYGYSADTAAHYLDAWRAAVLLREVHARHAASARRPDDSPLATDGIDRAALANLVLAADEAIQDMERWAAYAEHGGLTAMVIALRTSASHLQAALNALDGTPH